MLHLTQPPNSRKYYITSQNDLYQVDQFVRFFAPWGVGDAVVLFWHFWATIFCTLLAIMFTPFTWLEQGYADKRTNKVESRFMGFVEGVEEKRMQGFGYGKGNAVDDATTTAGQLANGTKSRLDNSDVAETASQLANGLKNSFDDNDAKKELDFGFNSAETEQHEEPGQPEQFGNMQVINSNQ